jgi:hypothetical protein
MFAFTDPEFQLDFYRQRSAELQREAAAYRMARAASGGRHTRSRRRSRSAHQVRPEQTPVAP